MKRITDYLPLNGKESDTIPALMKMLNDLAEALEDIQEVIREEHTKEGVPCFCKICNQTSK